VEEFDFRTLQHAIFDGNWPEVIAEAERLQAIYHYDPARWLYLEHCHRIARAAKETRSSVAEARLPFEHNEDLFAFDSPAAPKLAKTSGQQGAVIDDDALGEWKETGSAEFEEVNTLLHAEAYYRFFLGKFRDLVELNPDKAYKLLTKEKLQGFREHLYENYPEITGRLDLIYGNPIPEWHALRRVILDQSEDPSRLSDEALDSHLSSLVYRASMPLVAFLKNRRDGEVVSEGEFATLEGLLRSIRQGVVELRQISERVSHQQPIRVNDLRELLEAVELVVRDVASVDKMDKIWVMQNYFSADN
jgi:hypothetical protein